MMNLQELVCGVMGWIELAKERERWWALVNAVMKLRIQRNIPYRSVQQYRTGQYSSTVPVSTAVPYR